MSASLVPGAVFAQDFVLARQIGRGGSGVVWAAEQRSTGRVRALKVFAPMNASSRDPARAARSRARFTQEARIGARIQSPHVIEVVAAGVEDDGETPWMAMELLSGEDLAARIARAGPLSAPELLALFEQLTAAVSAAHGAGVLHLDLKPENLFLAAPRHPGEPFTLKVLDFGIGRMMREMRDAVTVTSAAGSPLWMAPEQSVEQQRVSPATDIWAMGLIAFRALTGLHYWRTGNAQEVSFAAWVLEMMTEALPPASQRAASLGVAARLPPGFDAWFARCVERDASARFQGAAEAMDALRPVLTGGVIAPPPTTSAPRRRRLLLAAVAAAALAAVGVSAALALHRVSGDTSSLDATQSFGGLSVRSGAATVFRHTDGNWHARVSYALRNDGAAPVAVRRESFRVAWMSQAGSLSTLPESVTVNPGLTVSGDIAWYRAASDPQPQRISVVYQPDESAPPVATQEYALVFAPTEPAPGAAPSTPVFTLPVRVEGDGLTFVHADGNRHARVTVAVENTTSAPLRIYRDHFSLRLGAVTAGIAAQPELTSWSDPTLVAPGATATGSVGFWFNGDPAPNPSSARLVFGPASSPQADLTLRLAPGPSPIR